MQFQFGYYCIETSISVDSFLTPSWSVFRNLAQTELGGQIEIHDKLQGTTFNHNPFWKFAKTGKAFEVTYFSNCHAQFSIICPSNEANVCLKVDDLTSRSLQIGLQYAVMLLLSKSCIGLHCVTIICGSEAIALCAPSGTGKTTLAKLLARHCEAAIVNGDFALLSADEQVIFEPTPFCGSSNICFNVRLPIRRIVFLEQAPVNRMEPVDSRAMIQKLCNNTFIPEWDPVRRNDVMQNICRIAEHIPGYTYAFAPTEDAAHEFRRYLNL